MKNIELYFAFIKGPFDHLNLKTFDAFPDPLVLENTKILIKQKNTLTLWM